MIFGNFPHTLGKVLHFIRRQSTQSMSIGVILYCGGIGGFEPDWQIGEDWRRLAVTAKPRVKPPMQYQSANPLPIQYQSRPRFGLAMSRQSMAYRGQSCTIPMPIHYQSALRQKDSLSPIQCQSATNLLPIQCQSSADGLPIWCRIACLLQSNLSPASI